MFQKPAWDVEEVCKLTNPIKGYPTCSAQAVTYGRRCKRDIASGTISALRATLERMTTRSPDAAAQSLDLYEAAELSVCWQHKGQIGKVARRWKEALEALAPQGGKADYKVSSSRHDKINQEDEDNSPYSPRHARGGKASPESYDELLEELWRLKEELGKYQKEYCKYERYCAEKKTRERRDKETNQKEEQAKREQEERERRRREKEKRQRQQEREAEEKRKREEEEKKEREENLRQRARKRQQEREDAATKEWTVAWKRYSDRWTDIEDDVNLSKIQAEQLPWPVKSGRMEDVIPVNIKQFFQKAPPVPISATAGEERYRMISHENKRWHTDKIISRFGKSILEGPCKNALNTISKVVVELRQEAQRSRCS